MLYVLDKCNSSYNRNVTYFSELVFCEFMNRSDIIKIDYNKDYLLYLLLYLTF